MVWPIRSHTHGLFLRAEIATRAEAALAPYCHRISIAGSVRRQRPQVKDIEIEALPWQEPLL